MQCGFTKEHYIECINLARDKCYCIIPVKDYYFPSLNKKKVILLRHDIDWSLDYAYDLASLEYDLGVCSSYYVHLHSTTYSALAPRSMSVLRKIKEMGHEIGLHYDSMNNIAYESHIIDQIIGQTMQSMTHHIPSINKTTTHDYRFLQNPNDLKIKYISDSGHNWREGCMCKHIGKTDKLHILTHPEWWMSFAETREGSLVNLHYQVQKNGNQAMQEIYKMLEDYMRELKIV